MTTPLEAQFITITIHRSFDEVNDYVSVPANFEHWAAGLGTGFEQVDGDEWQFGTSEPKPKIRFTAKNPFGVADHWVFPKPGEEVYVPLRVVPNGDGSEVTLTLFRQPEMSNQQFADDQAAVRRDLEKLKAVLEA